MVKVKSASDRIKIGKKTKLKCLKGETTNDRNSKLKPLKRLQNTRNVNKSKISVNKIKHTKVSNVNKKNKGNVKSKETDDSFGQFSDNDEDLLSIDEYMFADEDDWDDDLKLTSNKKGQKVINNVKFPNNNKVNDKKKNEMKSNETDESLTKFADDDDEYLSVDEDVFTDEDDVDVDTSEKEEKVLSNESLSDDEDDDSSSNEGDALHVPNADLEIASDESDFETENDSDGKVVTQKMLKTWKNEIQTDKTNKTIGILIQAFHDAVNSLSNENNEGTNSSYRVNGSTIFNGIVQLCVFDLGPALRKFLGLESGSKQPPHKCKKFVKVKTMLQTYFKDIMKILNVVTSSNIHTVILKHLHYMSPMIVSFSKVAKDLLRKLVSLWGTCDETVRVVTFLCIIRIVNNQQTSYLEAVIKLMYMTYVRNSKFVSTTTLPAINFMRRSLVEIFSLDLNLAYQHVFLYIRQLAIHLRNAITVKKKENIQTVYNWQFINSLKLWGNLLSVNCDKSELQSLVYPFVQVCLGTVRLIPTAQYFPLRFHVVQTLMDLSKETRTFIPILPFLVEILTNYNFNKKHQKVSLKPLRFTCILRLSKSQLAENGFKDAVIDQLYGLLLEYLASNSHSLAFPDLSLLCVIQIKQFVKRCSVANYCRKMRQLLEKIEQNNKFILNERKNITFNLKDFKQIDGWEASVKNKGTPLTAFYNDWNKVHELKIKKQATNNEAVGDYNLPTLKKTKKLEKNLGEKVELFPSDSDSEKEVEEEEKKPRRGKRGGKNVPKKRPLVEVDGDVDIGDDVQDIVEDVNIDDW